MTINATLTQTVNRPESIQERRNHFQQWLSNLKNYNYKQIQRELDACDIIE